MKKSLLTIGAVAAFAAGACAQGSLDISLSGTTEGFNTTESSDSAAGGWYTGNLTLTVFTISASGESSLATTINNDETSASTMLAGIALINSDFTAQQVSAEGGSTEAASQTIGITDGNFTGPGVVNVGTAGSLPQTSAVYYALVFETQSGSPLEGAIVLTDPANSNNGILPSTAGPSLSGLWPSDDQNLYLAPVPEPATLALAGLGGLSMLFLRRRKA